MHDTLYQVIFFFQFSSCYAVCKVVQVQLLRHFWVQMANQSCFYLRGLNCHVATCVFFIYHLLFLSFLHSNQQNCITSHLAYYQTVWQAIQINLNFVDKILHYKKMNCGIRSMLEMYSYGIYIHIFLEMQANCELLKEDPLGLQIVTRLEYCWRNTHTHAIIVLGSP